MTVGHLFNDMFKIVHFDKSDVQVRLQNTIVKVTL